MWFVVVKKSPLYTNNNFPSSLWSHLNSKRRERCNNAERVQMNGRRGFSSSLNRFLCHSSSLLFTAIVWGLSFIYWRNLSRIESEFSRLWVRDAKPNGAGKMNFIFTKRSIHCFPYISLLSDREEQFTHFWWPIYIYIIYSVCDRCMWREISTLELLTQRRTWRCCVACQSMHTLSCRELWGNFFQWKCWWFILFIHVTHIAQHLNVVACRYFPSNRTHTSEWSFPVIAHCRGNLCIVYTFYLPDSSTIWFGCCYRSPPHVEWYWCTTQSGLIPTRVGKLNFPAVRLYVWWNSHFPISADSPSEFAVFFQLFISADGKFFWWPKRRKKNTIFTFFIRFYWVFIVDFSQTIALTAT